VKCVGRSLALGGVDVVHGGLVGTSVHGRLAVSDQPNSSLVRSDDGTSLHRQSTRNGCAGCSSWMCPHLLMPASSSALSTDMPATMQRSASDADLSIVELLSLDKG